MDQPTAHALLRDRSRWRGARTALEIADNGDLVLARVPGPADGKRVVTVTPLPYPRVASGLALGPCRAVFVADTAHDRVLYLDGLDGSRAWLPPRGRASSDLPGRFRAPRGLACADDALLVADGGNARVERLAYPRLEAHLAFDDLLEPASIAVDAAQRLVVADAGIARVRRFGPYGTTDPAFDAALAADARLTAPLYVACDEASRVLVADTAADAVYVYEPDGTFAFTLPGPAGWQPGAVAARGARAYVADAATATIVAFDLDADGAQRLGTLPGWQGPVTAMALADDGALYIKPGLDDTYVCFPASTDHLPAGGLTAGPFDAGEDRVWERAWVDATLPAGTALSLEVAVAATSTPPPAPADWILLPSLDALVATLSGATARFVWWRIGLGSTAPSLTPRLAQARTATAAEDWLDHLPLTYRRADDAAPDHFLASWLKLLRGEFERVEEALDAMPRIADPAFAAPEALAWLAGWLGLELPRIADAAERRDLVARAVALDARRGTPRSIAEFVELHTGIRPAIVEAFEQRRLWVLGDASSGLGFDTCLPPLDPLGMVVPDAALEAGCCPTSAPADAPAASPCPLATTAAAVVMPTVAIGRAIVGESGPLAPDQLGLPLYADAAYRFCVVVDAYRAGDAATLTELRRIVDREKPAHTDYRVELVAPELRVGFQARVGIDTIVGGTPPGGRLGSARLVVDATLAPSDTARIGEAALDGSLTLG